MENGRVWSKYEGRLGGSKAGSGRLCFQVVIAVGNQGKAVYLILGFENWVGHGTGRGVGEGFLGKRTVRAEACRQELCSWEDCTKQGSEVGAVQLTAQSSGLATWGRLKPQAGFGAEWLFYFLLFPSMSRSFGGLEETVHTDQE